MSERLLQNGVRGSIFDAREMTKQTNTQTLLEWIYSGIFQFNNVFGFCCVSSQVMIKYEHPANKKTYTMMAENRYRHERKIGLLKSMIGPYFGIK